MAPVLGRHLLLLNVTLLAMVWLLNNGRIQIPRSAAIQAAIAAVAGE